MSRLDLNSLFPSAGCDEPDLYPAREVCGLIKLGGVEFAVFVRADGASASVQVVDLGDGRYVTMDIMRMFDALLTGARGKEWGGS